MKNIKIISMIIVILSMFLLTYTFAASVNVQINGEIVDFTDSNGDKVEAQTINSRTMVPLRKIFEILNCEINWDGTTKTVTATQGDKTIILQIDNKNATLKNKGTNKEEKIVLDSEPIIFENRTLVPFRFIGESLGMEVAWDSLNKTAIIINYDELAKIITSKCDLVKKYSKTEITHNYYDDADSSRNCNAKYSFVAENGSASEQKIKVSITGNSEVAKDIINEEWNNYNYSLFDDGTFSTDNYVYASMLKIKKNDKVKWNYADYSLSSKEAQNTTEWIKYVTNIKNSEIDINTYKELKEDLTKFANTFLSGSKTLQVNDLIFDHIDINDVFKTRISDSLSGLMLLNQIAYRFSISPEDLFEEFPTITYSFSESNGEITIKVLLKNEFKEREEFILSLSK